MPRKSTKPPAAKPPRGHKRAPQPTPRPPPPVPSPAELDAFVAKGREPVPEAPRVPAQPTLPGTESADTAGRWTAPARGLVRREHGEPVRRVVVYLPPDLARSFEGRCTFARRSMSDVLADLVREWVAHTPPPPAIA